MNWFTSKRFTSWALVLLVVLNLFTLGALWRTKSHRKHKTRPQGHVERMLERKLSLTQEQKALFKELKDRHHARVQELHKQMKERKEDFFSLVKADSLPTAAAELKAKSIGELHAEMDMATLSHFSRLRKELNPQQQQKLDKLLKKILHHSHGKHKRKKRHKDMRQRHKD